ncbi:aldehyde dehydrogenase family protein [Streptomyces mirabilis]
MTWNFPQTIAFFKIAPALAAGCVLVPKRAAGHPLLQHEEGFVVPCLVTVEPALSCTKASATHDMGHQGGLHRGTRDRAVQRPR